MISQSFNINQLAQMLHEVKDFKSQVMGRMEQPNLITAQNTNAPPVLGKR